MDGSFQQVASHSAGKMQIVNAIQSACDLPFRFIKCLGLTFIEAVVVSAFLIGG